MWSNKMEVTQNLYQYLDLGVTAIITETSELRMLNFMQTQTAHIPIMYETLYVNKKHKHGDDAKPWGRLHIITTKLLQRNVIHSHDVR
jgi:hypothetical protein